MVVDEGESGKVISVALILNIYLLEEPSLICSFFVHILKSHNPCQILQLKSIPSRIY